MRALLQEDPRLRPDTSQVMKAPVIAAQHPRGTGARHRRNFPFFLTLLIISNAECDPFMQIISHLEHGHDFPCSLAAFRRWRWRLWFVCSRLYLTFLSASAFIGFRATLKLLPLNETLSGDPAHARRVSSHNHPPHGRPFPGMKHAPLTSWQE